jgi:hypothetical protein
LRQQKGGSPLAHTAPNSTEEHGDTLLEISRSARIVDLSESRLRQLDNEGVLPAALRTANGVRLWRRRDVERFAQERARKLKGRA